MLSRPHQDEAFTKLLFFADKADFLWYGRPMDSADEGVVFRMGSNPEPEHSVGSLNADGPIVQAHASRPEPSDLLEVKRWMSWIALEEAKLRSASSLTEFGRELSKPKRPEKRGGSKLR